MEDESREDGLAWNEACELVMSYAGEEGRETDLEPVRDEAPLLGESL